MSHNTPIKKNIILIGASVRALAFSCLRAGLEPWCLDCFADYDLVEQCQAQLLKTGYPESALHLLAQAPMGPVLYTGGLENYPQFLEQVQELLPIAGITGASLKKCRDVADWSEFLGRKGLRVPKVLPSGVPPLKQLLWLAKPEKSGGGKGIFKSQTAAEPGYFLQEFIKGQSKSAIFCFGMEGPRLLGTSLQIPPQEWLHSTQFQYSGNIGPLEPCLKEKQELEQIAHHLTEYCQPKGLLNLDYILAGDRVVPLEINPRYSASMELIEYSTGQSLICQHLEASGWHHLATHESPTLPQSMLLLGKAIYYSPAPFKFPASFKGYSQKKDCWQIPEFADIPHPNQKIEANQPVLTIFGNGSTPDEVLANLEKQARDLEFFLATQSSIT